MQRRLLSAVLLVACMTAPALLQAAVPDLMKQADVAFRNRATAGQIDVAIEAYKKVLAIDPTKADAYGLIAMCYSWKAVYDPRTREAAAEFKECVEYAKLGVEVAPDNVPSNYWLAVCYAAYGKERGALQSLHLLPHVRESLKKVERLDRCYHYGGAYRINARIFQKLPAFKGGDINQAIALYQKALACGPLYARTYLFLAEAYVDADRKADARATITKMLALDYPADLRFEAESDKKEARALLQKIGP